MRRAISWRPVHAMLAAYPLAFFTAAFVTDIVYSRSTQMQWANFSVWLIAGGVAMAVVAALAGIVDAVVSRGDRHVTASTLHRLLTIAMMVVAIINGFIHSRDAWTSVVPTGLILSGVTALLAIVASWLGYASETHAQREAY